MSGAAARTGSFKKDETEKYIKEGVYEDLEKGCKTLLLAKSRLNCVR